MIAVSVAVALIALVPANNNRDSPSASVSTADTDAVSVLTADDGVTSPGGSTVVAGMHRRSDHVSLWRVGLAIVADHPIIGTGPDTYAIMFADYRDDVLDADTARHLAKFRPESPHNVYIATASGSGLFALAALGLLVLLIGRSVLTGALHGRSSIAWPLSAGVAASLAGHLVTDMFMTQETTGSLVFWVLMGAGVGTAKGVAEIHPGLRRP